MQSQWTPLAPEENLAQSHDPLTRPAQYLTFYVDAEMFAINILDIREIIEYSALTSVPMAPPLIRGVINLRGSVVPVVDLAVRLGRTRNAMTDRTCIVILQACSTIAGFEESVSQKMGIVVDAVSEVLEVFPEEIAPPPELGARIRADFIQGMGKINGKFIVLLNTSQVLSRNEITVFSTLNRLTNVKKIITPSK